MKKIDFPLKINKTDIDTGREGIAFINQYCPLVSALGLEGMNRVKVCVNGDKWSVVTLNIVNSPMVYPEEIILSKKTLKKLQIKEGDSVTIKQMDIITSFSYVRGKMHGKEISEREFLEIMQDIANERYSSVQTSAFLTSCATGNLSKEEIAGLTKAMVAVGQKFDWHKEVIVDKHCIGGIPGNRTTPIVISIVSAFGFTIPKTSSRAITSPSGTADTMEVFTKVNLTFDEMKKVVEKENACLIWGGATSLSPADDVLIKIEYDLDIDSEGQMIASIMSKKISAGSTYVLIDIPVGNTAKVRTKNEAKELQELLEYVGKKLGIEVKVITTDGSQPIGRGIGPALEAKDIALVLQNDKKAPKDLKEKSIELAGIIIEHSKNIKPGEGKIKAREILESGKAWEKFQAICKAQGALKEIPQAPYIQNIKAHKDGKVYEIDNRKLSQMAKMAGAPMSKSAGIYLNKRLNEKVKKGEVLFSVHSESEGELNYALKLLEEFEIVKVK
ncbi:thymidine phosphorylase family protein [Pseudomonadota bacterium]